MVVVAQDPDSGYWWIQYTGCDATCTFAGTETGEAFCRDKNTQAILDWVNCLHNGTIPPPSRTCYATGCGDWIPNAWGPCNVTCGGGTQSRTLNCVYNGTTGPASNCNATLTPPTVQPCNEQGCPSWHVGNFINQCSTTCDLGIRYRDVICMLTFNNGSTLPSVDDNCDITTKPNSTISCNLQTCPFNWIVSEYSNCTHTHMGRIKTRNATCINTNKTTVVTDSICMTLISPKPITEVSCTPCTEGSCAHSGAFDLLPDILFFMILGVAVTFVIDLVSRF